MKKKSNFLHILTNFLQISTNFLPIIQFPLINSPETCQKCSKKCANDMHHKHEIIEGQTRTVFCSETCLNLHMREDSTTMVCCVCRHRMQFYNCIRRNCDDRCFCSLRCAAAAETSIELPMRNDDLSGSIAQQTLVQPELKFDESDEGKNAHINRS